MKLSILILALLFWSGASFAQAPLPPGTIVDHSYPALDTPNVFSGLNQFLQGATLGPTAFIGLPTEIDGTIVYCKDCQLTQPCSAGGLGAYAFGTNGTWSCNQSGTIPTVTLQTNGVVNASQSVLNLIDNGTGAAGVGFNNTGGGIVLAFLKNLSNSSAPYVQTTTHQGATSTGAVATYNSLGDVVPSATLLSGLAPNPMPIADLSPGSNGQCAITSGGASVWGSCNGLSSEQVLNNQFVDVTVSASTTSNQTLFTYTTTSALMNTAGKTLRLHLIGTSICGVSNEQIDLALTIGGTTQTFIATTTGTCSGLGHNFFSWDNSFTCNTKTAGSSGVIRCFQENQQFDTSTGGTGSLTGFATLTFSAVNTTGALAITEAISFGTASTFNTGTGNLFLVESLN